jgi:epoxide hydrolase-like predicted phosphatase
VNQHVDRPVRAVVFDFGGVIITPITKGITELAERNGVDPRTMLELLIGPDETGDHPWHQAERGELTVAEIQAGLATYATEAGIELSGDEIEVLLVPAYSINEPVVARIKSLRAEGIKTGLLTNTFAEFRSTMERDLDLDLFDVVIESFAVGSRKPERDIYDAMAAGLGVDHEEIVYLDDFHQNLGPADDLGWRTIHVTDVTTALAELDHLVGRTDSHP